MTSLLISSTSGDLSTYREEVKEAVLELGWLPVMMGRPDAAPPPEMVENKADRASPPPSPGHSRWSWPHAMACEPPK